MTLPLPLMNFNKTEVAIVPLQAVVLEYFFSGLLQFMKVETSFRKEKGQVVSYTSDHGCYISSK